MIMAQLVLEPILVLSLHRLYHLEAEKIEGEKSASASYVELNVVY